MFPDVVKFLFFQNATFIIHYSQFTVYYIQSTFPRRDMLELLITMQRLMVALVRMGPIC